MAKNSTKTARRPGKTAPRSRAKKGASSTLRAKKTAKNARVPSKLVRAARIHPHTPSPPTQPAQSYSLRAHRYQVGQIVYFTSPSFGRAAATGSYTVVKLLPSEGDDYQYRIKSEIEAFERVAKESQLELA